MPYSVQLWLSGENDSDASEHQDTRLVVFPEQNLIGNSGGVSTGVPWPATYHPADSREVGAAATWWDWTGSNFTLIHLQVHFRSEDVCDGERW